MTTSGSCKCWFAKPRWTITRTRVSDTNWNLELACAGCGEDLPKSEVIRALAQNDLSSLHFVGFNTAYGDSSELYYVLARIAALSGMTDGTRLAAETLLDRTRSYEEALPLFLQLEQLRSPLSSSGVIRCLWRMGRRDEAVRKLAEVRAKGERLSDAFEAIEDFRAMDQYSSGANPGNINVATRGLALSTAPDLRMGQAWLEKLCEQYVPGYEQARALEVLSRIMQKQVSRDEQLLWCGVAKASIEGGSRKLVWFLLSNKFLYATHGKTIPATRISLNDLMLNAGYPIEQDWGFIGSTRHPRMFDLGRSMLMDEGHPLNGLPARCPDDPRGAVRLLPLASAVRLAHQVNASK